MLHYFREIYRLANILYNLANYYMEGEISFTDAVRVITQLEFNLD